MATVAFSLVIVALAVDALAARAGGPTTRSDLEVESP
jgi:hypothetical protein